MDSAQSERNINEANETVELIKSFTLLRTWFFELLILLTMPATRHSDARRELYGNVKHVDALYMRPGSQPHRHGKRQRAIRFGRAIQSSGGQIQHDVSHVNFIS